MFWELTFAGTQHGNLHQLPVTMSKVTHFILRGYTGTCISFQLTQEELGRGFGKNEGE